MGEKFYRTEDFLRLQDEWQKKLEASGFEDAERNDRLIQWHSRFFFRFYSPEEVEERQLYYRACWDFYWSYRDFKNERDREIWKLYCEGFSRRQIAKVIGISDATVQIILASLKKILQSNSWSSRETIEGK